jgi:hypothetical protein
VLFRSPTRSGSSTPPPSRSPRGVGRRRDHVPRARHHVHRSPTRRGRRAKVRADDRAQAHTRACLGPTTRSRSPRTPDARTCATRRVTLGLDGNKARAAHAIGAAPFGPRGIGPTRPRGGSPTRVRRSARPRDGHGRQRGAIGPRGAPRLAGSRGGLPPAPCWAARDGARPRDDGATASDARAGTATAAAHVDDADPRGVTRSTHTTRRRRTDDGTIPALPPPFAVAGAHTPLALVTGA